MKIHLYIKQHNLTGLLYFGKTQKRCPYTYLGSGTYWLRHLRKHGADISTLQVWTFDNQDDCSKFAIYFSAANDIVNSPKWANLRPENGVDGIPVGTKWSPEALAARKIRQTGQKRGPCSDEIKSKISKTHKGKKRPPHSELTRLKMSFAARGEANVNYGKSLSTERRAAISRAQKGKTKTASTKANMAVAASTRQVTILKNVIHGCVVLVFRYKDFCTEMGVSKYQIERNFKDGAGATVESWIKISRHELKDVQKHYFRDYLGFGSTYLDAHDHPKSKEWFDL